MSKQIYKKEFNSFTFFTHDDLPTQDNQLILDQFHSNIITQDKGMLRSDGVRFSKEFFSTTIPLIKTADCLPIILEAQDEFIFLHAGWRGLSNQILQIEAFSPHFAFIGPSIQKNQFEVSLDFKQHFPNTSSFTSIEGKYYFDLQKEASMQIMKNFPNCKVESSNICTFKQKAFHSYRENKTTKRNWHFIKTK